MGIKIRISIDLPYSLDVELPEGQTIDDVLGLFFGNEWELKYKEKDTEEFSSIIVNQNDFKRVGRIIRRTSYYDYESDTSFTNDDLLKNIFPEEYLKEHKLVK